ncbi:hypothetical protein K469DRAFT_590276, partial [Zopfia rhizophila CBS 207.26]
MDRPFECATCKRSFTRPDHLRRHEVFHSHPKALACSFCSRQFTRPDGLQRH